MSMVVILLYIFNLDVVGLGMRMVFIICGLCLVVVVVIWFVLLEMKD